MMRAWLLVVLLACGARGAPPEAWGTADYVAAGVPDPGHAWSNAELVKAGTAITAAADGHEDRLPRYRGARSGAVFARLIEAPADDATRPVALRLGEQLARYQTLNDVQKRYLHGLATPSREQIELAGALLHESVTMMALVDPFLATFSADDPSLETRRNGLATFRRGSADLLYGAVMVADDRRPPTEDRVAMLRHVAETIGPLWPALPVPRRDEIRAYLVKLSEATTGALHDVAAQAVQATDQARVP